MTRPMSYLLRMLAFLVAVAGIAVWLRTALIHIFLNNPDLNALILAILLVGIGWTLLQVQRLNRDVAWVEAARANRARRRALAEAAGADGTHARRARAGARRAANAT